MTKPQHDILVIGAGIVGVSVGLALQAQGRNVTIIDRKGVASETSAGNAGAFAFTEVEPLATPGVLLKAPKWLLDPLGPLSIPPSYALKILPWMIRFLRASQPNRYAHAVKSQVDLMQFCEGAFERQLTRNGDPEMINRDGQLCVYEGEKSYRAALPIWQRRKELGIAFTLLESPEAIAEIQPGLDPRFTHGGFTPNWVNTRDPKSWTLKLADAFLGQGGELNISTVTNVAQHEDYVEVTTDHGTLTAKHLVVCAGAWSHHLTRLLGDPLPLETERGYNTTLAENSADLRTHLTFAQHGFVMSKNGDGIRIGGAVELGGLTLEPNYKRADVLLKKAKSFMPALRTEGGTQWMGYRPSLPDSLPVIGRSPKANRVIYAFGHGHLGLTQSAGTAELVAALLADRTPEIDLSPFAPTRF